MKRKIPGSKVSKPQADSDKKKKHSAKEKVSSSPKKSTVAKSERAKPAAPKKKTVRGVSGKKTDAKPIRPKAFPALPVEKPFGFPEQTPELPGEYHEDRLVLMTKDPERLFSYWEITPERVAERAAQKNPNEEYREAIKLNWPARSLFEMNFALMPVSFSARSWYLTPPYSGLPYQIDLGWLGSSGQFISLLNSNTVQTPESWEATQQRLQNQGGALAHAVRHAKPLGASESMHTNNVQLAMKDWNVSSDTFSSSSLHRLEKKSTKRS